MSSGAAADPVSRHLTVNGVTYHLRVAGAGAPLLLLHGFTGSSVTWGPHVGAFAARCRTVAVDQPGHGGSDAPANPDRYRVEHIVRDLLALMDLLDAEPESGTAHGRRGAGAVAAPAERRGRAGATGGRQPGQWNVLGYSMGGRVALHLALTAPQRIAALVLESTSPGLADPRERAERIAADRALAERIERDGIGPFVDYWESLPLFASQQILADEVRARQRAARLANSTAGLANSLRGCGAGVPEPVLDSLHRLTMPVLLVAGELDRKYATLARTMADRMQKAQVAVVPGAGHAVHLEQPTLFDRLVVAFLGQD